MKTVLERTLRLSFLYKNANLKGINTMRTMNTLTKNAEKEAQEKAVKQRMVSYQKRSEKAIMRKPQRRMNRRG